MTDWLHYDAGPNGIWVLLLVTVALGGSAAYATGRAIALSWRPYVQAALYCLPLTGTVRFIQYALFEAPLLSPANALADFLILLAFASFSYRRQRARQMVSQYPWAFEPAGLLGWRRK